MNSLKLHKCNSVNIVLSFHPCQALRKTFNSFGVWDSFRILISFFSSLLSSFSTGDTATLLAKIFSSGNGSVLGNSFSALSQFSTSEVERPSLLPFSNHKIIDWLSFMERMDC